MTKKAAKTPGLGQRRCGTCNGAGVILCRICQGARTQKDWKHKLSNCSGCGGTGEQACIVCGQMGVMPRR